MAQNRIFFGSLPANCTKEALRALVSPYGEVKEVFIALDNSKKHCKGFGHVEFYKKSARSRVLKQKLFLCGRELFTEPYLEGNKL